MLGQAGGLQPSHLRKALLYGPASSTFVHEVVPSLLAGDRMAEFGLGRIVEELASLEDFEDRNQIPARMTSLVANLHREALTRFGPISGELPAISHLEQLSGRHLGEHPDATPGCPGLAGG
jgi:3-hydroxyisobutyrate dehydrogenase-like beta-hydroxyacid dehydrogenase